MDQFVAGLHRRRRASHRLAALPCGCRDPWPCRCDQPQVSNFEYLATGGNPPVDEAVQPPTERMTDAYLHAVLHLRGQGLLAAPLIPEMQTLGRRGPDERRLVTQIAEAWELAA